MDALKVTNLTKTYNNGFEALKGISLTVQKGDFFALLGPNGAGKSTTIGILSSLINKTSGTVDVFDYNLDVNPLELKKCLGIVPQEFNFSQFEKPFDILVNQAGFFGIPYNIAKQKAEELLNQLGIFDKAFVMSRLLSGGMKRRLMIARALVHNPRLLILDEPTAGVDIELRRSMWDFLTKINESGTTIILTTHYLEEAEQMCKNIAIINNGTIIENTSMRKLLAKLDVQSFIIELKEPIAENLIFKSANVNLIDKETLEVHIGSDQSINEFFKEFLTKNIPISSLRNKSNRLEELFVSLTQKQ